MLSLGICIYGKKMWLSPQNSFLNNSSATTDMMVCVCVCVLTKSLFSFSTKMIFNWESSVRFSLFKKWDHSSMDKVILIYQPSLKSRGALWKSLQPPGHPPGILVLMGHGNTAKHGDLTIWCVGGFFFFFFLKKAVLLKISQRIEK